MEDLTVAAHRAVVREALATVVAEVRGTRSRKLHLSNLEPIN